jgi:competence protein ComEA
MTRSRLLIPFAFAATLVLCAPSWSTAQSTAKSTSTTTASKTAKSARIDINTASKSELTALSGVDDASAQKIIDGRPYARKRDLVTKKIVAQTTYDGIKDEIVAKKSKK